MEANEEGAQNIEKRNSFTKKEECIEISNDRESSVESFYTNSDVSAATESEIINVDDIELSDEESWLYTSPKKMIPRRDSANIHNWIEKSSELSENIDSQETKNALVNKLAMLQLYDSVNSSHPNNKEVPKTVVNAKLEDCEREKGTPDHTNSFNGCESNDMELFKPLLPNLKKRKENGVLDLEDVHLIAKLQEESLRKSADKFLSIAERKCSQDKDFFMKTSKISKPSSVEDIFSGKHQEEYKFSSAPMKNFKSHNLFGSSTFLYRENVSCGSLPSIHPGYYSLKVKKTKPVPELKDLRPLPLHASLSRLPQNGREQCIPFPRGPARSSSRSRAESPHFSAARRDSAPLPPRNISRQNVQYNWTF